MTQSLDLATLPNDAKRPEDPMKLIAALILAAIATPGIAADSPAEACKTHIDKQIRNVDAEMKAGYKEPRGNQLRKRRSTLSKIRRECNSNPDAWRKAPLGLVRPKHGRDWRRRSPPNQRR